PKTVEDALYFTVPAEEERCGEAAERTVREAIADAHDRCNAPVDRHERWFESADPLHPQWYQLRWWQWCVWKCYGNLRDREQLRFGQILHRSGCLLAHSEQRFHTKTLGNEYVAFRTLLPIRRKPMDSCRDRISSNSACGRLLSIHHGYAVLDPEWCDIEIPCRIG